MSRAYGHFVDGNGGSFSCTNRISRDNSIIGFHLYKSGGYKKKVL